MKKQRQSINESKTRTNRLRSGAADAMPKRRSQAAKRTEGRRKTDISEEISKEAAESLEAAAHAIKRVGDFQVDDTAHHEHIQTAEDYDAKVAELTSFYEKKIYDLEQMLDISRSFNREIELNKLLEAIKYMCMAQMHVLSVDIFIRDSMDETDMLTLASRTGEHESGINYKIRLNHPLVRELFKEKQAMTAESLRARVSPVVRTPVMDVLKPTLLVPIMDKNTPGGVIFLGERIKFGDEECDGDEGCYTDYERSQIMSIAALAAVAISNASLVEKSSTDMMTRLKLKYYFFNILNYRLSDAMDRKRELSVLMFDIDHFKKFNDTYGHECGDYVLISVASLIKRCLRDSDLASRYGGEEFTVLLDHTGKDEAMQIAERIRATVDRERFTFGGEELHVTISGGVATFDTLFNPCTDAKALVDQADQGLYMSKHNGRNNVTYADPVLLK